MNRRSINLILRFALGLVLVCGLILGDASRAHAGGMCYVNAAASGNNNGYSWMDAYTSLQSALGALPCNEVWVAKGTYKPTSGTDRTISFVLRNGVALYGGFAGTETLRTQRRISANPTILSGEIGAAGKSDNSFHVVMASGTDSTARLDGFSVTAGNANGSTWPDGAGGGMYGNAGSPTLANLIFNGNSAGWGGGMLDNQGSNPSLTNVTFSSNSATYSGGGMFNGQSSPSLKNVTFNGNSASQHGGGMYNEGTGSPTLAGVTFSSNTAGVNGGGMYNYFSSPSLANVTFRGNTAAREATGYGGGMYNYGGEASLANVTFSENTAIYEDFAGGGGGMYNYSSCPRLSHVTFTNNWAYEGGGMFNNHFGNASLVNVTFRQNVGLIRAGGMFNADQSSPSLKDVDFDHNQANFGSGMLNINGSNPSLMNMVFHGGYGESGGGMLNIQSSPTLVNVTFTDNGVLGGYGQGGAMLNSYSNPTLTNVTISGNSSDDEGGGGGILNDHSNPIIANSIVYGNTEGNLLNLASNPVVTYSIVEGGYPGTGNLDADPLLKPLGNYGGLTKTMPLALGSPAIDKGTNTGCPAKDQRGIVRPQDGDGNRTKVCDMGATESRLLAKTFQSTGTQDGWILESTETSSQGGTLNATAKNLAAGDNPQDKQYRSILSFNTAPLPDTAVITSITLKIKKAGLAGTDPFTTHGNILVDVRKGAFSNNAALEVTDFQAPAGKNAAMTITNNPVGGWYSKAMGAAGFAYINKLGLTQFRLRFAKDDNDDLSADYIKFYSGDYGTAAYRPQLIITYYVP